MERPVHALDVQHGADPVRDLGELRDAAKPAEGRQGGRLARPVPARAESIDRAHSAPGWLESAANADRMEPAAFYWLS